ncbi:MAG TPA: BatD family protein, partial [Gammaproteobacteria bacterium]|nr:BatD family protein [Gammaproteobacteria bacterium]
LSTLRNILYLLFMIWSTANAATITAQTDRMNITIDEAFNVTFTADGSIDKEPDFSPLKKDFDILSQSQGSNISIINGDVKKTSSYTLTLMPKSAGNLTIPAISFGKDTSQPLAISVGAAATTPGQQADLILEVTPSRTSTWVQGQIILTVKLMSAINLRQYNPPIPDAGKFDVSIESLGDAKQSQTTQGNRNYLVIEQKFALYPQQAGKLKIEPMLAEVEAVLQSRNYFDPFNTRSKIMRARSRPIEIFVQDMPAQFAGKTWLPASDVQLVEEWSPNPPVFKVGEPVTRTLNLFADGLTAAQLPQLMGGDINGIKQYPDQPVLNNAKSSSGIIGGRREKIALIPTRAGSFTLPAIEISWWNTKTGVTEVARLEARTVQVLPGNAATTPSVIPDEQFPVIENTGDAMDESVSVVNTTNNWLWVSVFLASGWLLTGLAWWYSRYHAMPEKVVTKKTGSPTASTSAIKKACDHNQAAQCKTALINWAQQTLSADILNLDDFITCLNPATDAHLIQEIERLNAALYSARPAGWQGRALWQQFQSLHINKASAASDTDSGLEPLYK